MGGVHSFSMEAMYGMDSRPTWASVRWTARRITVESAKLLMEAGMIAITAFISPFQKDREMARNLLPHGVFGGLLQCKTGCLLSA